MNKHKYTDGEILSMREDCVYYWIHTEGTESKLFHSLWHGNTSCHSWADIPVEGFGCCDEELVIEYWETNREHMQSMFIITSIGVEKELLDG